MHQLNRDVFLRYFASFSHTLPSGDSIFPSDASYTKASVHNGTHQDGIATSFGSYYNFLAMSAGTAPGTSTGAVISGEITADICPASWRAPSVSQQKAVTSYTTTYTLTLAGYRHAGSTISSGSASYGFWWSRSIYSYRNAWTLFAHNGVLDTGGWNTSNTAYGTAGARDVGISFRCIAK